MDAFNDLECPEEPDLCAVPGIGVTSAPPGDPSADESWDRFLEEHPAGEHVQSSRWARLKATEGWRAIRIEAADGAGLKGGAQMLVRRVPVLGSFAYVPKGPVASDPGVAGMILSEIEALARLNRVHHLTVQPPRCGKELEKLLEHRGFRRAPVSVAPTATLVLDLGASEAELLAAMGRSTRYNVKLGIRRGLTMRVGGRGDIPVFHRMLAATAGRQGFSAHSEGYLEAMWDAFDAVGQVALLLIESEGRVVSGLLGIGFGDTFIDKLAAWSGDAGRDRPNEAVVWSAIGWARDAGYRFFDFEGIDHSAALALRGGHEIPSGLRHSVTSFKVGFGGTPVVMPSAWYRIDNRLIGLMYDRYTRLPRGSLVAKYLSNQIRRGRAR